MGLQIGRIADALGLFGTTPVAIVGVTDGTDAIELILADLEPEIAFFRRKDGFAVATGVAALIDPVFGVDDQMRLGHYGLGHGRGGSGLGIGPDGCSGPGLGPGGGTG